MKIRYFAIIFLFFLFSIPSNASNDTIVIENTRVYYNLKEYASIFTSESEIGLDSINFDSFNTSTDFKDYFYFGFNLNSIFLKANFHNNTSSEKMIYLRFSNSMIHEIKGYSLEGSTLKETYSSGIIYPYKSRPIESRNYIIPIKLQPESNLTYIVKLTKTQGRPLVTNIDVLDSNSLQDNSFKEYIVIGLYIGLSALCVIIGLSFFFLLKNRLFLYYSLYVFFLSLFILAYNGILQQYILNENMVLNKYWHYVIFGEITQVLFVVFAQKFLEAKKHQPKLYKTIIWMIYTAILLRLGLHFFENEIFKNNIVIFMKIWYGLIYAGILLIAYQIIFSLKNMNRKNVLFGLAYLIMIGGTSVSILYHSFGIINGIYFNLSILLYSFYFEIILITIALGFFIVSILNEKKSLLEVVEHQKEQNLTKFIILNNKEKIYLKNLKHIKSDGNYLEFYLDKGKVIDRNRLKLIKEMLPTNFIQTHRSYIINKNFIKSTNNSSVIIFPDIEIPISRKYKNNV
ncbi:MAG: 7TM diverse intracellular signaling domain-containing protein [Urechidicola sp.]|nr:7TM diverse intracellular signaling domain-containing protein [Urechidicola sp.]